MLLKMVGKVRVKQLARAMSYPRPPKENEEGLTAKDIMDRIRGFYERVRAAHNNEAEECAPIFFS